MIPNRSHSNHRPLPQSVFLVSHSRQEAVCKEIYDYLICKKLMQLKKAVLYFNKAIKKILR